MSLFRQLRRAETGIFIIWNTVLYRFIHLKIRRKNSLEYIIYADISFKRVKTGASRVHYLLERAALGIEKRKMKESLEKDEKGRKEGRKEGRRKKHGVVAGRRRQRDGGKRSKKRERERAVSSLPSFRGG